MSLTLKQRRGLRRPLDLNRFQPMDPNARARVDERSVVRSSSTSRRSASCCGARHSWQPSTQLAA
ncbi:MAG: hypothetical protein ING52_10960 [Burkholderiales bacterium]|nr:hypothetical protein [Burkholderiales bacterium]